MIELFDRVYNCAHRGASGHAPENTLSALEWAINLGADMAEIDVQLTADGHLVLFHDDTLERTSNGRGKLTDRTLTQLRALDAGAWFSPHCAGQIIPTLSEAIALVQGRLGLNIELKSPNPETGLLDTLLSVIADQGFGDDCVVTSFDRALINELAARDTGVATGYIIGRAGVPEGSLRTKVNVLSLEHSLVTAAELEFAAAAGKAVYTWTVDSTEEMSRMISLGINGVITNYPDRFPTGAQPPTG